MKPYRFLAEADTEFQEQVLYFDQQAIALGDKFIAAVETAIIRAREYPEGGSPISKYVRGQVLRGFKYSVLYVNEPDELVVVAIAPHRKRPNYWRRRLKTRRR